MKSWRKSMLNLLIAIVILAVLAFFFGDRLIFVPPKHDNLDPNAFIMIKGENFTVAATSIEVTDHKDAPVLLYSHGNAEDIIQLQDVFREYRRRGFSIFGYDYEGYGASSGRATEKNTYRDIEAAYNYLTEVKKVPPEKIYIYGRSVGSGPSIYLALKKPAAGLILEAPFRSVGAMLTGKTLSFFDRFPNICRIGEVKIPILIFHGELDKVVKSTNGQALAEAAGDNARLVLFPLAGHNDVLVAGGEQYWAELEDFVGIKGK